MTPPQGDSRAVAHRPSLVRLGLARDPSATQHVAGFLVAAVATVLLTRGLLAATGYPQLGGGGGLHIAHVLWGGLLMMVAVVLAVAFLGPVVRPVAALVGGIGFGLFIDEIGKFVTADNDYFYAPAASLIYLVVVVVVLLGEVLLGRRPRHPSEQLAGAVDQAVAGVTGGFTHRTRRRADRLVEEAGDTPGAPETRALLDAVQDDSRELPDIIGTVARWVVTGTHHVVRARWVPTVTVAVLTLSSVLAIARGVQAWLGDDDLSWWVYGGILLGGGVSLGCSVVGLVVVGSSRGDGYQWFRRAVLVSLLLTQIFLFRISEWSATVGLVVDLLLLGLVAAEIDVERHKGAERR